jgi:hypothetical protein
MFGVPSFVVTQKEAENVTVESMETVGEMEVENGSQE